METQTTIIGICLLTILVSGCIDTNKATNTIKQPIISGKEYTLSKWTESERGCASFCLEKCNTTTYFYDRDILGADSCKCTCEE